VILPWDIRACLALFASVGLGDGTEWGPGTFLDVQGVRQQGVNSNGVWNTFHGAQYPLVNGAGCVGWYGLCWKE
jgi:hypothetical protein